MNPPSEDIKDILVDSSVGIGTFGTDVFINQEPDTPDACVTIYDTGGFPPGLEAAIYYPTVQVRVRGAVGAYKAAYTKAETIRDALHSLNQESWGGTRYVLISSQGDIFTLPPDDKNRPILTLNFRIMRT